MKSNSSKIVAALGHCGYSWQNLYDSLQYQTPDRRTFSVICNNNNRENMKIVIWWAASLGKKQQSMKGTSMLRAVLNSKTTFFNTCGRYQVCIPTFEGVLLQLFLSETVKFMESNWNNKDVIIVVWWVWISRKQTNKNYEKEILKFFNRWIFYNKNGSINIVSYGNEDYMNGSECFFCLFLVN